MKKIFLTMIVLFVLAGCTNLFSKDLVNDQSDDYLRIDNPTKRYFESSEKGISIGGEEQKFFSTDTIRKITQFIKQDPIINDVEVAANNNDQIIIYLQLNQAVTASYVDELKGNIKKFAPNQEILIYTREKLDENL